MARRKEWLTTLLLLIIVALLSLIYFLSRHRAQKRHPTFWIEDTAAIEAITFTRYVHFNPTDRIHFRKLENGEWALNEVDRVDPYKIQMLLNTLKQMRIREIPPEKMQKTYLKFLKTNHVRVTVKLKGGKKKVFLIGPSTKDGEGTIAMFPQEDKVYVIHIPAFAGTLTSRFSTQLQYWRDYTLFNVYLPQIQRIEVIYPHAPEKSFRLEKHPEKPWLLDGSILPDSARLVTYLKQFGRIFAEIRIEKEKEAVLDSLRRWKIPYAYFKVYLYNNDSVHLQLFPNPITKEHYFTLRLPDSLLFNVQHFVFNKFLRTRDYFVPSSR